MIKLFLILILSSSFAFADYREEAIELLERHSSLVLKKERLDKISTVFLGLPYGVGGPLGEGPTAKYDQDPLYRFDTFDCVTYVETVIALALSRHVDEFETHLDKIRYKDGQIDYLTRNHFTDLQWIPFNIENGYFREINEKVVPANEIKFAEAIINLPNWLRSIKVEEIKVPLASEQQKLTLLEELKAEATNFSPTPVRLPYISINQIISNPKILNKVPTGTIVSFVRPNWDLRDLIGTHQNISHQGLLFRRRKQLFLRHASSGSSKTVVEVLFLDYLKPYENHATMKGIHLMGINF